MHRTTIHSRVPGVGSSWLWREKERSFMFIQNRGMHFTPLRQKAFLLADFIRVSELFPYPLFLDASFSYTECNISISHKHQPHGSEFNPICVLLLFFVSIFCVSFDTGREKQQQQQQQKLASALGVSALSFARIQHSFRIRFGLHFNSVACSFSSSSLSLLLFVFSFVRFVSSFVTRLLFASFIRLDSNKWYVHYNLCSYSFASFRSLACSLLLLPLLAYITYHFGILFFVSLLNAINKNNINQNQPKLLLCTAWLLCVVVRSSAK